jgi:OHCU decarboxylase
MIDLKRLNELPQSEFVAVLGRIFEHSPWVAERAAAHRPFASRAQLIDTMRAVVRAAALEEQLALIRAHPRLGARGRALATLTTASLGEQRSAGLDACTDEEYARLLRLNDAYFAKFRFPFILAVRGHDPQSIISCCVQRLNSEPAAEHQAALEQIGLIAGYRLADAIAADPVDEAR